MAALCVNAFPFLCFKESRKWQHLVLRHLLLASSHSLQFPTAQDQRANSSVRQTLTLKPFIINWCLCMYTAAYKWRSEDSLGNQFSPSTLWLPGTNSGHQAWLPIAFTRSLPTGKLTAQMNVSPVVLTSCWVSGFVGKHPMWYASSRHTLKSTG